MRITPLAARKSELRTAERISESYIHFAISTFFVRNGLPSCSSRLRGEMSLSFLLEAFRRKVLAQGRAANRPYDLILYCRRAFSPRIRRLVSSDKSRRA
jgi:hypothetical protein